jgi:cation transport ATPase
VVEADPALGRDAALRLAAALAQGSSHPAATALVTVARARDLPLPLPEMVVETPGGGLSGVVDGTAVALGSEGLLRARGIAPASTLGALTAVVGAAGSVAWLAVEGRTVAAFVMADRLRPEAPRAVRRLRALDVRRLVMVTGDRAAAAAPVGAARSGSMRYWPTGLPQEKLPPSGKRQHVHPLPWWVMA